MLDKNTTSDLRHVKGNLVKGQVYKKKKKKKKKKKTFFNI